MECDTAQDCSAFVMMRLGAIALAATVAVAACDGRKRQINLASVPPDAPPGPTAFDTSHAAWDAIVKAYVKEGTVDYTAIRKERGKLDLYLVGLQAVDSATYAGWSEKAQLAFWINAYNAYTVKLIVDLGPVKSIKDLGGTFSSVFNKAFIPLDKLFGKAASLNNIEHDTLRAKFNEPRIHFALVCASKSCPALRNEAYRADILDQQLDDQARTFLKDASKNRYDAATKTLHLSSIFKWFKGDFERAKGSVREFVDQYLDVPADVTIEHLGYDWSLNGK